MGLWPSRLKRRPPWRDLVRVRTYGEKNETEPKEAGGRENKTDKKKDLEMLHWEEICNTNSI